MKKQEKEEKEKEGKPWKKKGVGFLKDLMNWNEK